MKWHRKELYCLIGGHFMICAEFERTKEGWKVDAEWRGYGNADMIVGRQIDGDANSELFFRHLSY